MTATTSVAKAPMKTRKDAPKEKVLVITRLFDAPRSLVFRMWTEPEHLARWFGCEGSKIISFERDLHRGGEYRLRMKGADGADHRLRGVYREIVPLERLVFTWANEDADGNLGHETVVTVTLAERGRKTEMTLHHAVFETTEARDLHGEGWTASLDRLAEYVIKTSA